MVYKNDDGFYYCREHKCKLQWLQNKLDKTFFLKCPNSKKFECGTAKISKSECDLYEQFAPNRDANDVYRVSELIDADNERESY